MNNLTALIEKLTDLEAKATSRPWQIEFSPYAYDNQVFTQYCTHPEERTVIVSSYKMEPNGRLISESRNAPPTLLTVIKELRGALSELADAHWRMGDQKIPANCVQCDSHDKARTALSRCDEICGEMK